MESKMRRFMVRMKSMATSLMSGVVSTATCRRSYVFRAREMMREVCSESGCVTSSVGMQST